MARWTVGVVEVLRESFLQTYYALHLLLLLSFFVLRYFTLPALSPLSQPAFLRWEAQAGLSVLVVLVIRFAKSDTLERFIGDALLYGKCLLLLLVSILDPRILPWYLLAVVAIFLLWQQPNYHGSGNVVLLTPLQLESHLLNANRTEAWLVEFGAAWSPNCIHFRRTLAGLSSKYSSEALRFGRVDVGCYPNVASKYGIEFGLVQRQLPTLVLFEGGGEVARLPGASSDGVSLAPKLTESMIVRYFELDLYLIRALSQKAGPPRGDCLGK